nr:MAG: hypothetical protein E4H34_04230 [Hyphomicrobiales bacterium]
MRYFAAILIVLALVLGGFEASAQPGPRQNGGQQMQPLNNILGAIRSQYPGQLSDVQGPTNGRYLIKWLTPDGQVLLLDVDARTGRVLGVRGDGNFRRQNFAPAPAFLPERNRSRNERIQRPREQAGPPEYFSGNSDGNRWRDRPARWNR